MAKEGFALFLSENAIWLTDHVPLRYIEPMQSEASFLVTGAQAGAAR